MIVTIEQRGGFIGYLRHDLDTGELTDGASAEVQQLANLVVDGSQTVPPIAREPEYHVTVSVEGHKRKLVCGMAGAPETVQRLVKLVRERGKPFLPS